MADAMRELTVQIRSDPDAQATVTDFLDYTEFLPSDLIRSLTLIGKLDETYLASASTLHDLTHTYGTLPSLPPASRPEPRDVRSQISQHLHHAINAREASFAEASRLYDVVDRHYNRLTSIISKLRALPQPPSRDPTPPARSTTSPQSHRRNLSNRLDGEDAPAPRITLRLNAAQATAPVRGGHGGRGRGGRGASKHRKRRVTVPGEVLPPVNPDSPPPSSEATWGSLPPSPIHMASSRVGNSGAIGPREKKQHKDRPGRPPKIPKQAKIPKIKPPKPPRVRPPGTPGTNVHSTVAGISTSNALALLRKPPENCAAGSEDAPWLKLTPYEMAKLRKRMKKNAVWNPSETMIRRELADLNRGPEMYHVAKARSDATGEPFIDAANIAENARLGIRKPLAEGEISVDSLGMEELQLSNRGMKLNEAKKLKKENMRKEEAAVAALEAEMAARRLAESGSALKAIFAQGSSTPSPSRTGRDADLKSPKKRQRDGTPTPGGVDPSTSLAHGTTPNEKRRKLNDRLSPLATTTTTVRIPLLPPGSSPQAPTVSPIGSSPSLTPSPPPPSATLPRRPATKPNPDTSASHRRRTSRNTLTPTPTTTTPTTAAAARPRRASTTSLKLKPLASPTTRPPRRGKRPAPGPVKQTGGAEGGAAVSVGRRKAAPRRGGKQTATRAGVGASKPGRATAVAPPEEEEEEEESEREEIDPNEPTYCVCGDVSFGTMIACESDDCEREWFHLECVGLTEEPKRTARWYCPDCRVRLGVGGETGLSGVGARAAARKK